MEKYKKDAYQQQLDRQRENDEWDNNARMFRQEI